MKAIFALVVAVAAIAYTDAKAAQIEIQEEHPITWYDCSGKNDGNYVHPYDCTRFISCSGGVASQRDCAPCNQPGRCIDGRTVYNASVDACLWADETQCQTEGTPTTESASSETTAPSVSTTTPSQTTTTEKSTVLPKPGDPCDPEECLTTGWCLNYLKCNNKTNTWDEQPCGQDLLWNPLNPNGTRHIHGGNCDYFDNLQEETKQEYRGDERCLRCFWRELGKCNSTYEYQPAHGTWRNVQTLKCSPGLVFVEEKETCQRCEDVKDVDGNPCC